jgi:(p)ppGpp synthase/HD superfamily hydrolase
MYKSKSEIMYKAKQFAEKYHKTQFRRFSHEPYVVHPISVAERLMRLTKDNELIIAAFLHDVLEDTEATYELVKTEFGETIANIVNELTSDKAQIKIMGKANYLADKINKMSVKARIIKFADREHNVKDLSQDAKFGERYANETRDIIDLLKFTPTELEQIFIDAIEKKIAAFVTNR